MPTLRLTSAIAENGPEHTHQKLARCGVLLPIADMLRDALVGKFLCQYSEIRFSCV